MASRSYPEPKVGDIFGCYKVVRIIGRGHRGRSDLRVEYLCVSCHKRGETYEFNLRNAPAKCSGKTHHKNTNARAS